MTSFLDNYSQAAAIRCLSTSSVCRSESNSDYHTIIKDIETGVGSVQKKEFQAETRMLLDIVAKSLYSEREVFIRELISNASDALEKLRYLTLTGEKLVEADRPLEIHIATDPATNTFIVQVCSFCFIYFCLIFLFICFLFLKLSFSLSSFLLP